MKPDFDKRAANLRPTGMASIVDETVHSMLLKSTGERFRRWLNT
jgi:hypothetical protein